MLLITTSRSGASGGADGGAAGAAPWGAAVAAAFILLNSTAGLAGNVASFGKLSSELPIFLVAAGLGALLGTWLGIDRLPRPWLLRTLGIVLFIAGAKLLLT